MKRIVVRVNKSASYKISHSHRTSDGWIYDEDESISAIAWFSVPIRIDDGTAKKLSQHLRQYDSFTTEEDVGWGHQDSIQLEPLWTEEVVTMLNSAFDNQQYIFVADTNDGTFIEAFRLISSSFWGKDSSSNEWGSRFRYPFSPFKTIEETKRGVSLLAEVRGQIPVSWIEFIIERTNEDLSDFLSDNQLINYLDKVKICLPNGELRPCLKNVFDGAVAVFKQSHPGISFREACKKSNRDVVQWYLKYGADPDMAPVSAGGRYTERKTQDYDYDDYTQDELDDMYRDAFNDDPSAEWNID